ncbi:hypothetical protein BS329_15565 [Amycolatopsis coloradensis]|uniref:Uncharacterized protein n=1 Tax=Amycolatopsis coloradensis TaxID=76021 RepID=A0A1R0KU95_9PSEU|nr:hypothetical protein [Amycolatopsis coloradensis]OLZ51681.1 hypothetical protein BS329_15565 [Amycolatopsis coloradensis]
MPERVRYELRIARLDDGPIRYDPGDLIEFFVLDDEETETVLARHFVPLACAAEGEKVRDRLSQMRWLNDYVLHVFQPGSRNPVLRSRATRGWED